MKNIIICLLSLFLLSNCSSIQVSDSLYTQTVSLSSEPFIKAKYFTELVYITEDKELVAQFKECYISRRCYDAKFKQLRKWSIGKDRKLVIEVLDIFLETEFEGK